MAHELREGWLTEAAELMRKHVFTTEDMQFVVPEFRVSVGWPVGKRKDTNVIGECHNTGNFDDGVPQVFISPRMKDRLAILRCLAHEMIHVLDDCQNGHRGHFAYVFKRIGMTGKRTETEAGEELRIKLADIADQLGKYPGAPLQPKRGLSSGPKKQASRMFKVACPDCGYVVRASRMWMEVGFPTCVCGTKMAEVA
jgi:hypothetical protein